MLIPDQLAGLAARLGVSPGSSVADSVDRLLAQLRTRDRWLLVFDNAERPSDIAGYRPGGAGHVLITSRFPGWGALGGRQEVDVVTGLARSDDAGLDAAPEQHSFIRRLAASTRVERRAVEHDALPRQHLRMPIQRK